MAHHALRQYLEDGEAEVVHGAEKAEAVGTVVPAGAVDVAALADGAAAVEGVAVAVG